MKTQIVNLINGYWVDANNNRWSQCIYTKEQAENYSVTLVNCFHCSNCSYCSRCSNCSRCLHCSRCSDFESNPQRITSNNIGSRNSQTTYYWNNEHEQIVCGCFRGSMQEFKDEIKHTHENNEYAKQYNKWIKLVEKYKQGIEQL